MSGPAYYLEVLARANMMVEGELIDDDGTGNEFETEQAITDTPTLSIPLDPTIKRFSLEEVYYWLNPANAETYELVFFEGTEDQDVDSLSKVVFRSGNLRAGAVPYFVGKGQGLLPRDVDLEVPGVINFMTIWSGAPGNTPGFVKFRGRQLA